MILGSLAAPSYSLMVFYGSLADLGPYKSVSSCKSNPRDRMTRPGRAATTQKAGEATQLSPGLGWPGAHGTAPTLATGRHCGSLCVGAMSQPPEDVGMTHRGQWSGFQRHFCLWVLSSLPSSLVSGEARPLFQQAGGAACSETGQVRDRDEKPSATTNGQDSTSGSPFPRL